MYILSPSMETVPPIHFRIILSYVTATGPQWAEKNVWKSDSERMKYKFYSFHMVFTLEHFVLFLFESVGEWCFFGFGWTTCPMLNETLFKFITSYLIMKDERYLYCLLWKDFLYLSPCFGVHGIANDNEGHKVGRSNKRR